MNTYKEFKFKKKTNFKFAPISPFSYLIRYLCLFQS